jgi:hypothetical protein
MARYEITVACEVGPIASGALDGFDVRSTDSGHTVLVGDVVDQAALHGLLNWLQDLQIDIVEFQRLDG